MSRLGQRFPTADLPHVRLGASPTPVRRLDRLGLAQEVWIKDEAEKKKAREALATGYLPAWAGFLERQLGDGPFFAGATLNVVDLKLHVIVRWFAGGQVDHIPATIFAPFPKLTRIHDAVRDDARVKAWYAKG